MASYFKIFPEPFCERKKYMHNRNRDVFFNLFLMKIGKISTFHTVQTFVLRPKTLFKLALHHYLFTSFDVATINRVISMVCYS